MNTAATPAPGGEGTLVRRALGLALLAFVLALPQIWPNPYYVHLVALIAIYAILLLGLDVVVGYTGEVSLGHASLFGVGAYAVGVLATQLSLPAWAALPAAVAASSFFGLLLALPALRVTGPYLAMVTLAFGTIVQILINEMDFLTNGPLGISLRKPEVFGHRLAADEFYYLVLAVLLATLVMVHRVLRSHLGRAFEALRDSPIASDCMGVSVYRHKVYAFVFSAALAGLAGGLFTYSEEYISPNTYSIELATQFLLAVIMGGRKTRSGPVLGAVIIVMLPNILSDLILFREMAIGVALLAMAGGAYAVVVRRRPVLPFVVPVGVLFAMVGFSFVIDDMTDYRLSIFGLMILLVVYYLPDGIVGFVRGAVAQIRPAWVHRHAHIQADAGAASALVAAAAPGSSAALLEVDQVLVQFGGLTALNRVTLAVRRGTVHGLIGPNGSGKSTMMNVLTGIYRPGAGSIRFDGNDLTGRTPAQIAASGIARTFQNVQLFGEMTVIENVLVGLHHGFVATLPEVALATARSRQGEARARARAASLLDFVGLLPFANEEARNLPYGKQRLLEIARALALDPRLLLLDEPAAGLTAPDILELVGIVRKIRDHGITVLLIEHHMDVVMGLCDTVSVLDFGNKIAEGAPAQVQADPKVIEAYLGGAAVEVGGVATGEA